MSTVGVENTTEYMGNSTNSTGLSVQEIANTVGFNIGELAIGSQELTGLLLLGFAGFTLYKANASLDISAAVMVPTLFLLADIGYLPMGSGLVYATIMAAALLMSFGLMRRFR